MWQHGQRGISSHAIILKCNGMKYSGGQTCAYRCARKCKKVGKHSNMSETEGSNMCELCGAAATHRCSGCRQVVYCSQEHQRQHWKQHKQLCRAYEVKSSPDLGRYLVASRDLGPGDIVTRDAPLVIGPKHHSVPQDGERGTCLGCFQPVEVDSESRCPRCLWPACGPDCPIDNKVHAAECAILRSPPNQKLQEILLRHGYRYEAITPLRCLLLQKTSPSRWQQILCMESHDEKRGPGTEAYKEASDIADFLLISYLESDAVGLILKDCCKKTLHRICGILDVNCLDVSTPMGVDLVALYPTVCLMEHSCMPNTRHTFDMAPGPHQYRVTVSAARHIHKGEHISTMYTHALWGTQARQEHLKITKYFSCRCQRCADPTELGTHLSSIKCLAPRTLADENKTYDDTQWTSLLVMKSGCVCLSDDSSCGGTQLPTAPLDEQSEWRCDTCPMSLTSVQVYNLVTHIGEEVETTLRGGPTVKQLEELLSKLETLLHPHHYHCYAVKHSLVQLYGHQHGYQHHQLSDELLQKKAAMCRELLATTETLDPGCARLALYSSVLQYELHRAITQLARRQLSAQLDPAAARQATREARELLLRAISTLQPEPELSAGQKMLGLVQKSLRELDAWVGKHLQ